MRKQKTNVGALSVRNTKKNLPNCAQKGNKGITLVALILTIVVLLILAVVAIRAVQGDGILSHAKNSKQKYSESSTNEQSTLESYADKINSELGIIKTEPISNTADGKAVKVGQLVYVATGENTATVVGYKGDINYLDSMSILNNNPIVEGKVDILPEVDIGGKKYTVTEVHSFAFFSMGMAGLGEKSKVTEISIPKTITEMSDDCGHGGGPKQGMFSKIIVDGENQNFSSENGILYNKSKTKLICYPPYKNEKDFNIPDSVTELSNVALVNLQNLENITINSKINLANTPVGMRINGISLKNVFVDTNNPNLTSENGILFNKEKTELLMCPEAKEINQYTIPSSVTSIQAYAFSSCTSINNLIIPSSVTTVGTSSFSGWKSNQTINVYWKEGEKPEGWDPYWTGMPVKCDATIQYAE